MKQYLISDEERRQLINYLATRPYSEVANGIAGLLSLKEAPAQRPDLKAVEDDAASA